MRATRAELGREISAARLDAFRTACANALHVIGEHGKLADNKRRIRHDAIASFSR